MSTAVRASRAASPPRPRGLPLVGHTLDYTRDPLGFLQRAAREHGDFVELRFPTVRTLLVSDPAWIERIVVTEHRSYVKDRFTRDLRRVLRDGLLTSEGDLWRRQRRLANPAFHRERIAGYAEIMTGAAEVTCRRFRPGETRDVHADMMSLTLDIVTRALFSAELGADGAAVADALGVIADRYADPLLMLLPFLDRLPTSKGRRFWQAVERLDEIVYRILRTRRAAASIGRASPEGKGDLLGMLLEARDEEGGRLSDVELRDLVMTLFLAGHETTAIALGFAFHLLSENPAVDAALASELESVLGDSPAGLAHLPRLRYTEAVILESMRLYPPVWALGRQAAVPVEIGGHRLAPGSQVWMSEWVVHRDPRWFQAPEEMLPERWLEGGDRPRPKFAYFPFGGGPRLCIGQSFAMMEAVLVLATIARRFRLRHVPGRRIELLPSVTLRPRGGLPMLVEARPGGPRAA